MDDITITLGTTSEIVQKAIEYANANIALNWITFGLLLGIMAMMVIGLIIGISVREPFTITIMLIGIICFVLMAIFCFCNVSLWEQRIEAFSQNPDEAVEYYIDNVIEVSHD